MVRVWASVSASFLVGYAEVGRESVNFGRHCGLGGRNSGTL